MYTCIFRREWENRINESHVLSKRRATRYANEQSIKTIKDDTRRARSKINKVLQFSGRRNTGMSRFSVWRICDCEILRRYLAKAANQSIVVNACIRVYVVELRVCRCSYENQYPTTDRPTDRPTHRPNRAQTHTTAPSPRRTSCFLSPTLL